MAAQFDQAKVVLQPGQQEAPAQTNVFEYGANVAAQIGGYALQDAAQQTNRMSQLYGAAINTASAGFDRVLAEYNKYAEQKAKEEAPAAVKYDGNYNIIPPSSFYPPGISTRAYGETYAEAYRSVYKSSAEQELINHAAVLKEKYAADPAAFRAGMDEKRQAMQVGLDKSAAPWIDMRGQQITAQGITQLTVQSQSIQNKVLNESANRDLVGIANDAARAAAGHPVAQGGGGSPSGYDNNVGNIVMSGDTYSGGKGLPYKSADGSHTFETFQSAEHGVAAAYSLVKKKVADAGGTLSFIDLVNKWSPNATPQEKANYAAALAKGADALPGAAIPVDDAAKMAGVLKAMNRFEKGKNTVSDEAFTNGIKLANGDKAVSLTNPAHDIVTADPRAAGLAADMVTNGNIMAERLRLYEIKAKAAGDDPAMIERNKAEMVFNTQMIVISEQIKNSSRALYGLDGNPNPGAVADAQKRIEQIATSGKFPGREDQVRAHLNKALDYAQTDASRRANQIQVDDKRSVAPQVRQMTADAVAANTAKLNNDPTTAQAITRRLDAQVTSYLNDPRLSDSVAMTLAQAGLQSGAVSRAAFHESVTNRLQSLGAIINTNDPSVGLDAKARAHQQVLAIQQDAGLQRDMTAGHRAFNQGLVDKVALGKLEGDHLGMIAEANAGTTSPVAYRAEINKRAAAGIYGSHPGAVPGTSPAQLGALMKTQEDNYNKNQATIAAAAQGMAVAAAGGTPNATQIAAQKDKNRFNLPGQERSPDWSDWYTPQSAQPTPTPEISRNAAHRAQITDYTRINGFAPEVVKEVAGTMRRSPNQADMDGWVDMYNQLYAVAGERIAQRTGRRGSDKELVAEVGEWLGPEPAAYLQSVSLYGAEKAFALNLQAKGTSVTGQLGQPNDASLKAMDTAASNFARDMADPTINSTWFEKLAEGRGIIKPWRDSENERAVKGVTGVSPDVAPGALGRALAISPAVSNVTFDPALQEFVAGHANADLAVNAQLYKTVLKSGQSLQDYAFMAQMQRFATAGIVEATTSPDGSKTVIGFKSFAKATAEKMGRDKLSTGGTQATLDGLVQGERRMGGTGPEYDRDSLTAVPYIDSNNQAFWFIAGRDKFTGAPVKLMDISQHDPRLRAEVLSMQTVARDTLALNTYGSDGKPITDPDRLDRIAAGFTSMVMAPMKDWLMEHYATGAVDKQAFVQEFDKHLRALDQRGGLAPDWRKTIEAIGRDETPRDGRNNTLREIARSYIEAKGPEASIVPKR